jgi:hypothetical protein
MSPPRMTGSSCDPLQPEAMDWQIALLLAQDGLGNAAIYALVALVAPLGPMIYRLAFAPLAEASVLVLQRARDGIWPIFLRLLLPACKKQRPAAQLADDPRVIESYLGLGGAVRVASTRAEWRCQGRVSPNGKPSKPVDFRSTA